MADASVYRRWEGTLKSEEPRLSTISQADVPWGGRARRQLLPTMPMFPSHANVQELAVGSGRSKVKIQQDAGVVIRQQVSGVSDKGFAATWRMGPQPQSQDLYHEFQNTKEKGLVMLPRKFNETEYPADSEFAVAMKRFMTSYLPTSTFKGTAPVNDWSREAENLLKELTDNETHSDADGGIWNTEKAPCNAADASPSSTYDSWSTSSLKLNSGQENFDIHRRITLMKPSPYPGASPASSGHSADNQSSDNDADDEDVQSSADSVVEAADMKYDVKRKQHSLASTTFDSGYTSSSTDYDSWREGDASRKRLGSDSDETSSISTAPSSPRSTRSWEGPNLQYPIRYTYPPPPPPFLAGVSAFPVPPPAQFLPPPMHAHAAISAIHPPAFLPGMPQIPPPNRNVAFVTSMPPPYSQPHFVQQRNDMVPAQTVGGTYHKHKPWITDEILEMIAVRDRLYKRMKKHPATDIVEMYKKVRNMVVGMTRNAKRSYEKRMEERMIERQLKNTSQVAESVNMAIASKSFPSRAW